MFHKGCACGNKTTLGGMCNNCSSKNSYIQKKLNVGAVNDPLEQEADNIAEAVVNKPAPSHHTNSKKQPPSQPKKNLLQAKSHSADNHSTSIQPTPNLLNDSGKALPNDALNYFEPRFGVNLNHLRVHHDKASHESAQNLHAKAYTVGNHIVFNRGQYSPESHAGKLLLAHEITHAIQQSGGYSSAHNEYNSITPVNGALIQRTLFEDFVGLVAGDEAQRVVENLRRSVEMSPRFFTEIFVGEVLDSIIENWPAFLAVTVGLIATESLIAGLAATPTGISQLIAAILQALVIVVMGFFAGIEIGSAIVEGTNWFQQCMEAGDDEQALEQASRSFLRMIRHIMFAILVLIGVRARVQGAGALADASAARSSAIASQRPLPPGPTPPGVTRITSSPRYRPPSGPASGAGSSGPVASATEGALARSLPATQPAPITQPAPVTTPAPLTAPAPRGIPNIGPRASVPVTMLDGVSATGAGLSASTSLAPALQSQPEERDNDCGPLPISWPTELPVPGLNLVRTNAGTREFEGIDDGTAEQRALAAEIRAARYTPMLDEPTPPSRVCFDYEHGDDYDAHHIHPRFLGGGDYYQNLCALEHRRHMAGHRRLNDQNAWINTYQQCGINSGTLTRHPQYTEYYVADMK